MVCVKIVKEKVKTMKKYVCKVCGYVYEGDSLPADFKCPVCKAPASAFNEVVGEIGIRHKLTDRLLGFGGNIGYEIRPSKRGQGYGTKMLSLALDYAKENLGLKKALITCDSDNYASEKVMINNGGILGETIPYKSETKFKHMY